MATDLPISAPVQPWSVTKLHALLNSPTPAESPSLLASLSSISPTQQDSFSYDSLHADVERRSIAETENVLNLFENAQNALDGVVKEVSDMETSVTELRDRLENAKKDTGTVIGTTTDLRKRLEEVCLKQRASQKFVDTFVLNDHEKQILEKGEVTEEYLNALKKLERIHEDSKLLLRSSNQKLGLDVLRYSATTRESCYETLYKFIQSRSANLDSESVPQILTLAIVALRPRPMLLRYCAEEVGSAKRASLVTRFVKALTKGGPGGIPRPIELHAHDPLRYTNDMLAWMHQALATEKELVVRLFGDCADVPAPSSSSESTENSDAQETKADQKEPEENMSIATKVLNTIFEALIRPFRVRFEQALEPTPPVVVLFKLATLLEFYANLMSKLLGGGGGLVDMLMECNSVTMYAFFSTWKDKMISFKESSHRPLENLTPPSALNQSMSRLEDIMATMDTSLASEEARRGQIVAVLEVILTPLQSLCENLSTKLNTLEREIYMINCINAMKVPLQGYSNAASRVKQLEALVQKHLKQYVMFAARGILKQAGLYDRLQWIRDRREQLAASEGNQDINEQARKIHGMDIESLSISVKNFYAMLFSGSGESLGAPGVSKISDVRCRNEAKASVAGEIVHAHNELHDFVTKMDKGERVGMRDPEKVKVILTGRF